MILRSLIIAITLFSCGVSHAQETQSEEAAKRAELLRTLPDNAAKRLFGGVSNAAPLEARAIGSYAKGCLAGASALPVDGESWQVMRLSRNRNWGHPQLIRTLETLARQVPKLTGWPGILVGDISQPRGGPMLTGHASHQIGLDADVWLTPKPEQPLSKAQRETMPATNMVNASWMDVDRAHWTPGQTAMIRAAAQLPNVARIFVNPAIKVGLCREAGSNRAWLSKVRPMWGHNYHFHIRIACPAGSGEACEDQAPPPDGDGCGKELSDWLALQHKALFGPKKDGPPSRPKPPMTLDALPDACREVLVAR
ncbi:MAG: penicillin-insensitive murein endopeptidase [Beijerinckiaceae bacterium]|nr:penicillin-insensitive murein endopeptidase [Beijerinckiaceae bacterium]